MKLRYIFPVALALCASPALATDRKPSANALPLSTIIATLEETIEIEFIDEIEWEGDGYWKVTLFTKSGQMRELRIDPVTGQPR
ncbi:MAG: PepSY domain-containing protein [Roseinatronobacter sp.]